MKEIPPSLYLHVVQLEDKLHMRNNSPVTFPPLCSLLAGLVKVLKATEPSAHW